MRILLVHRRLSVIERCPYKRGVRTERFNCSLLWFKFLVAVLPTDLQSLSKILKHLCAFPLPQGRFGYHSGLSASKYVWLNTGEGEGTLQWEQKCEE